MEEKGTLGRVNQGGLSRRGGSWAELQKIEWVWTRKFLTLTGEFPFRSWHLKAHHFRTLGSKSKQLSSQSPAFHLVTKLGSIGLQASLSWPRRWTLALSSLRVFFLPWLQTEMVKQVSVLYAKAPWFGRQNTNYGLIRTSFGSLSLPFCKMGMIVRLPSRGGREHYER